MNGFVVSGLLMLSGVVLLSPMMIMACPKFGDVEADLTGKLEVASMPDGATKDWAGFLHDRRAK
jgi:hypothetical protein